ncbi:MAG: structural protein P5 [Tannerella sp.]|nr:structural protein P5 [Tannerella sp.]
MGTRGLNNNNPLNIIKNGDKFAGEVVPSADKRFKQFKDMPHGYRAGFVILGTYLTKHKRNTIDKIIHAWAPPVENDTTGYAGMVERWSGVPKDRVLTLHSGEDYIRIVAAMSRVENGLPAVMTDVEAGFALQSKMKAK